MRLIFFQWLIVIEVANDVLSAPVNDSPPVPKNLANGNQRLSPEDIHMSATQSVTSGTTSKTFEEPINGKSWYVLESWNAILVICM